MWPQQLLLTYLIHVHARLGALKLLPSILSLEESHLVLIRRLTRAVIVVNTLAPVALQVGALINAHALFPAKYLTWRAP